MTATYLPSLENTKDEITMDYSDMVRELISSLVVYSRCDLLSAHSLDFIVLSNIS